jgi:hypothetical protein
MAVITEKKQRKNRRWRSPGKPIYRQIHFQLDHFFIQKNNLKGVLNAKLVGNGAPSDHGAVMLVLRLATKLVRIKWKCNGEEEKGNETELEIIEEQGDTGEL